MISAIAAVAGLSKAAATSRFTKRITFGPAATFPTIATVKAFATWMSPPHSCVPKLEAMNANTSRGSKSFSAYRICTLPCIIPIAPAATIARANTACTISAERPASACT